MPVSIALELPVHEPSQVGHARRTAMQLAQKRGCDEVTVGHIGIVVTELATNLVKHAREGLLILRELEGTDSAGLEILSIDRGPGIGDLGKCLTDGFSTAGSPGTGLGAVRRLSAEWDIFSEPGSGTVQVARLPAARERQTHGMRISGLSVTAPGESECGDAWLSVGEGSRRRILVADGLGHGAHAAVAAREAAAALTAHPAAALAEVLLAAHQALRATRGAAVAIAELDLGSRTLRYAGVGNIAAFIAAPERTQNLVSVNGTLGAQSPRVREFSYDLPPGSVVVLYSDGLTSHVRLDSYRGLTARDPAVIVGVLYRDFKRGRDDATVVVATLA